MKFVIAGEENPEDDCVLDVPLVGVLVPLTVKQLKRDLETLVIPVFVGAAGVSILVAVLVVLSYS